MLRKSKLSETATIWLAYPTWEDHARVLYQLCFELRRIAGEFVDDAKRPIKIRIGLNSGPAVSGVIGKTKFAFDVWGDTINTAARLEAHGEPDKVHMSECTYH